MVRAKKHLGQHFLKNPETAGRIAEALSGEGYSKVLEIGPGMGVLTQHLLAQEQEVFVVEIDTESVHYLEEHFERRFIAARLEGIRLIDNVEI